MLHSGRNLRNMSGPAVYSMVKLSGGMLQKADHFGERQRLSEAHSIPADPPEHINILQKPAAGSLVGCSTLRQHGAFKVTNSILAGR